MDNKENKIKVDVVFIKYYPL